MAVGSEGSRRSNLEYIISELAAVSVRLGELKVLPAAPGNIHSVQTLLERINNSLRRDLECKYSST